MKRYYKFIFIMFVFILSVGISHSYNNVNKNILILNSYDSENVWTKSQVSGILDTLKESDIEFNLYVEYMDAKRFNDDIHLKQMFNYLYNKYDTQDIDYIIATDDSAFSFLNNNSNEIFGDAKIVFSGLNYLYEMDRSRFTGIYEKIDIKRNIEFALKIFPNTKNVYLVGEDQITTRAIALEVDEYLKSSSEINVEIVLNENVEFLKNSIEVYPKDSIVFFTVFNMDDEGNRYSYEDGFMKIMSDVDIPIFSFWSFYDDLPIVGGYVSDAYLSGRDASLMLLEIAKGKLPSSIEIMESEKVYKLNYDMLKKFGVSSFSMDEEIKYINKPKLLIQSYEVLLIVFVLIILLLLIIIILLYRNNIYSKENIRLLIESKNLQEEKDIKLEIEIDKKDIFDEKNEKVGNDL